MYDTLWQNGVAANLHYIPVHRQPYYEKMGFKSNDFPEAENLHREVISIPMYPGFSQQQQDVVVTILESLLS